MLQKTDQTAQEIRHVHGFTVQYCRGQKSRAKNLPDFNLI